MDVLGKLVQGTGCSADGTVAAQNPLSRALDNALQGQTRGGRRGSAKGAPPPNALAMQLDRQRQHQHHSHHHAQDQEQMMYAYEQQARHRQQMEEAFHAQEAAQHHAAMEAAFADARHAPMHRAPPPMHGPAPMQMQRSLHHAPVHSDAWVDEFKGLHLDESWNEAHPAAAHERAWQDAHGPMHHHGGLEEKAAVPEHMQERQAATRQASSDVARMMSQNPDPKWQQSEFLKFMNDVSSGQVELDEQNNEVKGVPSTHVKADGALEAAWDGSFDEGKVNRDMYETAWSGETTATASKMENAFADAAAEGNVSNLNDTWDASSKDRTLEELWNESDDLEKIWEKAMAEAQAADPFEDVWEEAQVNEEYVYKAENPYLSSSENFERGVQLFNAGQLQEAILAFEAEVQQHPENSEAWRLLGECHAENDEDKSAIVCLERAVEEDPYNLNALLALGVSHVNELNPQGALKTLKAWVQHNPKFHGLEIQVDEYSDGSLMDEVMQLMLQAQQFDPQDTDVHVVLGVLYNVSRDYDAAALNFRQAAEAHPNEYTTWNKLGATLANSSRSSEAIPAYHKALEIKPRYARGWLNLGISHANLGNYEEATKCYLQALNLNNRADHVWSYLRVCFTCMERFDLIKLADTRDVSLFRDEFSLIDL